jgi:hypothetical protein
MLYLSEGFHSHRLGLGKGSLISTPWMSAIHSSYLREEYRRPADRRLGVPFLAACYQHPEESRFIIYITIFVTRSLNALHSDLPVGACPLCRSPHQT